MPSQITFVASSVIKLDIAVNDWFKEFQTKLSDPSKFKVFAMNIGTEQTPQGVSYIETIIFGIA